MKRIISLLLAAILALPVPFAMAMAGSPANGATHPAGNDYLAMSGKERVAVVKALIDGAKEGGVKIKQTPVSYCIKLDKFYARNPKMKSETLAIVLKTLIIMEYDWAEKGGDKDQLARRFLGDEVYRQNKARNR